MMEYNLVIAEELLIAVMECSNTVRKNFEYCNL